MSTSGDLRADRRFAWAAATAADGDHAAAADLFEQVIERVPAWAPGWAALAAARERAGEPALARAAWARVDALDPLGTLGAPLHLARIDGVTPARMESAYVAALFDDYAPRFDRHLTGTLAYRGPEMLIGALDRVAPGRTFARALDLGCGTGLMGMALGDRAARVDGVDLSPRMIERARATGRYEDLAVGPIEETLRNAGAGLYDLVTAADMLVYVGDLAPTLAGAARALATGGVLAFTLQRLEDAPPSRGGRAAEATGAYILGADLRFAHAPRYVKARLEDAGIPAATIELLSTRTERGVAVPGLVAVAIKP